MHTHWRQRIVLTQASRWQELVRTFGLLHGFKHYAGLSGGAEKELLKRSSSRSIPAESANV